MKAGTRAADLAPSQGQERCPARQMQMSCISQHFKVATCWHVVITAMTDPIGSIMQSEGTACHAWLANSASVTTLRQILIWMFSLFSG
jgi:hypothetical protein